MPYKDPEKQRAAQRKYEQKRRGKRHTIWMCVFYEESSPYWHDGLDEQGVATCVSPVHDRDVWTAHDEAKNPAHKAGKAKKAHRHLLTEFENPVSYEDFKEYLEDAGIKSTNIKFVKSMRGMGSEDDHAMMGEMRMFIVQYEVKDFWAFQSYCDMNRPEWSRLLDRKCYVIEKFISSVRAWANAGKPDQSWVAAAIEGDRKEDRQKDPDE